VLIILMAPSMMQLSEFLNPADGNSPLAGNEVINTSQ
jgi:hypothetical protein